MNPRLDLVVGCNGAGKSTLVDRQLQPLLGVPFVNADEIAKRKWPTDPESHSYEAAKVAELTGSSHLSVGEGDTPVKQ